MTLKNRKLRWLAGLLALALVVAMIPVGGGVVASGSSTVKGDPETVKVGDELNARENDLNKGWKFNLGDVPASGKDYNDSGWTEVDLPHDFSIIQNFTSSGEAESGFLPGGTGWYRKTLVMPGEADGKTFLLNFDGVYMHAYVYVNGTLVGENHYGYNNFAIDITDHLICDGATENVIAVKAVNNLPSSRWYSGSGIYRDVTLLVLDPVHVDLNGTHVTTPDIASGSGKVNVEVDVVNDGDASVTATVKNTVYAKGSDTAVATAVSTVTVAAGDVDTATNAPVVSNPALWSIEAPNLYIVKTEVIVGGQVVDTYETEFGFRWFTWSNQGFSLNGKNVKLNGVCLHHDQGAAGSAAYYDAMYRQLSIMKDMGCNAIRTSHNPADEDFIAICDELGLLVIEEHFDGLVDPKNKNSQDFSSYFESTVDTKLYGSESGMTNAEYAARSIVKRDRNAACVFAWSFGNEIQEGTYWNNVSRYDDICANYIGWVNAEDGTRIVTSGDNNRGGDDNLVNVLNTITAAGGVVGFNYANSAGALNDLLGRFGGNHQCIIASETSSHTNSRGQYRSTSSNSSIDGKYHLTSYDTSAVSWGITAHDSIYNTYQYDGVAGEFVWTGFDYIGEPTPWNGTDPGDSGRGAIPNSSYFGIVETTGFEKDSYYLYRAQWNKAETTLHLVTAWDRDNMINYSDGKTLVWVYSNAPVVKLYRVVNGETIHVGTATRGERTSGAGHTYYTYTTQSDSSICTTSSGSGADALYAVFNVEYAAGTLYAKAFDEKGNEITLSGNSGKNTVTTPGSVAKLAISKNRDAAPADGSSLIYVEVDVTDANGNLDTTATNNITFTVSGPGEIVGVDNGDQATTKKYQNSSAKTSATTANINAYAGKALVIVRTTEDAGTITVNVESSGLTGGTVTVNTQDVGSGSEDQGLVSYTMVKDYSVKVGTAPTLETTATGTMANGTTVSGTIVWNEVSEDVYGTAGDHTITGTLTLDNQDPIPVTARLHVIPNVIDLLNISTATLPGVAPTLPSTVRGVMADGTLAGEFSVTWNAVDASQYDTTGEVVTLTGTAVIFDDETKDVTCTVRVAEAINTESVNVAPMADSLTQNINGSDRLESILNGIKNPGDNTNERWSNWGNRINKADATLALTWATAQSVGSVNLHYYYDNTSKYPESVEFSYSLNGQEYTVIGHTAQLVETYNTGAMYTYTFDHPINPVGLKVTLTQQNGTSGTSCVALTELEVMTYAASLEYKTSADLSGITVGGVAVDGFSANTLNYETGSGAVAATTSDNAGITVLPAYKGVVRILTVSEDGTAAKTYAVTQEGAVSAPSVSLTISTNSYGGLVFKGTIHDHEGYTLVSHGILFVKSDAVGTDGLTDDTLGRNRVTFSSYDGSDSFSYILTDNGSVEYAVRAFLVYLDSYGNVHTVYSDTLIS